MDAIMNFGYGGIIMMMFGPLVQVITGYIQSIGSIISKFVIGLFTVKVSISARNRNFANIRNFIRSEMRKRNQMVSQYTMEDQVDNDFEIQPMRSVWFKTGKWWWESMYIVPNPSVDSNDVYAQQEMTRDSVMQYDMRGRPTQADESSGIRKIDIYFIGNRNIKERMIKLIEHAIAFSNEKINNVSIYENIGALWQRVKVINPRKTSTLFLSDEIRNTIEGSIERFKTNKTFYEQHCLPYHYTFLFEGPPGNGKTSTIVAMASKHNKDIYYLNLNAPYGGSITMLMSTIPSNSFLVIEDIDRDIKEKPIPGMPPKMSISSLLNSFDGILATNEIITFITANNVEKIPKALLRPGRIDSRVVFTPVCDSVFEQIICAFFEYNSEQDYSKTVCAKIIEKKMSISKIINIVINLKKSQETLNLTEFLRTLETYEEPDAVNYEDECQTENVPDVSMMGHAFPDVAMMGHTFMM